MKNGKKDDESYLVRLKSEIEDTFGKKISTSGDCVFLCDEILNKLSYNISVNTLRRFFGLVKSEFLASATTLNILSKYCGFDSFDEFKNLKKNSYFSNVERYESDSILNYLVTLFKYTPVQDSSDKTFFELVRYTIPFLQRHPELIDKFQRAIAKTKSGQEFYFEQFVHIDELNGFYGNGVRYYLIEKNIPAAQAFGHSLLCLKYWLSENPLLLRTHYGKLPSIGILKNLSLVSIFQVYAVKLLRANIKGLPGDKIISEIHHLHVSIGAKTVNLFSYPFIEYLLSSILVLTGHPEDALYFINFCKENYSKKHAKTDPGFYQSLDLIEAMALYGTGREKQAESLYLRIRPSDFYFLSRKTNTILYLILGRCLKKNNSTRDKQLQDLILQTGYTRLNQLLIIDQ